MTAYALFTTFILGGLTVVIVIYSHLAYNDGKALKRIEEDERRRHAAWRLQVRAELEDEDMKDAVELVTDKLGGTILNFDKVN